MSRIGNKPVILPEGVTVEDKGNALLVKGKKGEILVSKNSGITVEIKEKKSSSQDKMNKNKPNKTMAQSVLMSITQLSAFPKVSLNP